MIPTKFVLIILIASHYGTSAPALSQQVYDDEIACAKAGDAVSETFKNWVVTVMCTPEETPAKP